MSHYLRVPLYHPLVWLVFTPNIFVVPKCMGGLHPFFNLKQFNCYIHIPTFKRPTYYQMDKASY